jgi:hypothetical protein
MPRLRFLACLFAIALLPVSMNAAEKGKAITSLADVDEDFHVQGEYLGSVVDDRCCCHPVGLQVVAMGNGEFTAVEYEGGLPGYGWKIGGGRAKYAGKRDGGKVVLTGDKKQIEIQNGHATIKTVGEYRTLGRASHVERESGTMGSCAPCGAVVLFDGTNTDKLKNGKMTDGGLLMEGTETAVGYGDMRLHLEFRLPYMPLARGQGRANSGVYVQSRYEVQILDSFGLDGEFNECGALYRERKPDLNMCLPPLSWQTYDIWFRGPRFGEDGKKTENARFTVWLNGVPVQDDIETPSGTGAGKRVGEGTNALPTKLQNHSNPVRFRNIWLVETGRATTPSTKTVAEAGSSNTEIAAILKSIGYVK